MFRALYMFQKRYYAVETFLLLREKPHFYLTRKSIENKLKLKTGEAQKLF